MSASQIGNAIGRLNKDWAAPLCVPLIGAEVIGIPGVRQVTLTPRARGGLAALSIVSQYFEFEGVHAADNKTVEPD